MKRTSNNLVDFGTILSIDFVLCIYNVYMAKDKDKRKQIYI